MTKYSFKKDMAYRIIFILILLAISFLSFYKLNVKYVDPWDEARHGVNAWEMMHGGSMIQSTYLRQADYYNLKPPLSMWGIMAGLFLFRDPVFGLRFYSVICYLILAVFTGLMLKRFSDRASLFAMAALAVNMTPFLAHMVRAGDADSLYVLLFSAAMLSMMRIRSDHRFLYVCGLCFSFAFLTKSFHAMIIAVIGALFLVLSGLMVKIRFREWIIFVLSALLPVLIWAILRYRIDGTVFFVKMWETDVLGRTSGQLHNNIAPFSYYFSYYFGLMSGKLQIYLFAAVISAAGLVAFISGSLLRKGKGTGKVDAEDKACGDVKDRDKKDMVLAFILWIVVPFLAFSCVSNKLLWYQYPSVTGLMIASGASASGLLRLFKNKRMILYALYAAFAFIWLWYYAGTLKIIDGQGVNDFQQLVRAVAGDEKTEGITVYDDADGIIGQKGLRAYVDYDGSSNVWQQQDVFIAESYGGYSCVNGGVLGIYISSVKENKKGLVFVSKDLFEDCRPLYEDMPVLAESEEFLALVTDY